ncbi:MAG TPA: hypothetical protein VGU66_09175 [Candidatus Elarobacter sp.]|nr:hypothetical protein [Candidatus Elarobacter sp.]
MFRPFRTLAVLIMLCAVASNPPAASAQGQPDSAALIAAQRQAMVRFAYMDGVWRGPAWTILPSGERHDVTQTERIGPFLDGSVKVLEGRGYNPDGTVGFNAFGVISFQPAQQTYTLRSYALGYSGDFVLAPTPDGYVWQIPAGPMTIRYTATIRNGTWREVGDRIAPGKDPVRFFEMNLKRVGDTKWPGEGAVSPQ